MCYITSCHISCFICALVYLLVSVFKGRGNKDESLIKRGENDIKLSIDSTVMLLKVGFYTKDEYLVVITPFREKIVRDVDNLLLRIIYFLTFQRKQNPKSHFNNLGLRLC